MTDDFTGWKNAYCCKYRGSSAKASHRVEYCDLIRDESQPEQRLQKEFKRAIG